MSEPIESRPTVTPEVSSEIQKLSPSAIIELFKLELDDDNDSLYFHSGTNELKEAVIWQGKKYLPLPIQTDGFAVSSKGVLPRPKLTLANIHGLFTSLVREYKDLIGMRLIRRRTFARFLDAENFANGNPTADPDSHLPDEIWFVDQKLEENKATITWELASAFDLQGVMLPKRQIIQNYCQWQYRGGECGYKGRMFTIDDKPCSNPSEDVCSKRLSSCIARFHDLVGEKAVIPFGGFPGATRRND